MIRFQLAAAALLSGLSACAPAGDRAAPTPTVGMPNPASVHCVQQGGRVDIRNGAAGQYGVCVFQDGRQCEEWALFRDGRCAPAAPPARTGG